MSRERNAGRGGNVSMQGSQQISRVVRFETFELNLKTGDDIKLTVQFPGHGLKKLMMKFARLQPA